VLLHGFTGHPRSWDALAVRWAGRGLSVIAPALPGHDPGSPPIGGESFEDAVARIETAITGALGGGRAILVGYSMGARVGLGLLARRPRWLSRAVLVAARIPPADPAERQARRQLEDGWCIRLRSEGLEAFLREWEALPLWSTQAALPEEQRARQREIRSRHDPAALATAVETLGLARMPREPQRLAAAEARVTLVVGARDEKFVPLVRELAGVIPGAVPQVVPAAGHNVVVEAPDALARLVEGDLA
jgi:2-succinyl-6-hydroxy-2,4-cyclohexadiene-1-carboxylate synthase